MRKRYKYKVTSRYPFPMDMLRFDYCWPADSNSAAAIAFTVAEAGSYNVPVTVTLLGIQYPTLGRWWSFMWSVDRESIEEIE